MWFLAIFGKNGKPDFFVASNDDQFTTNAIIQKVMFNKCMYIRWMGTISENNNKNRCKFFFFFGFMLSKRN